MALTLAAYWPVYSADFINFDDDRYITENPHVQAGLTAESIGWAFTTFSVGNWHPLTWMSHQLDWELWGTRAGGHHFTNLLLHIASALLLFGLLHRMTRRLWPSALVAALFALHPLHVESVAWVAERKDVLSIFFGLLAIHSYVGWTRDSRPIHFAAALLLYAMSLMSKPTLVTLPFALLLLDAWPLKRITAVAGLWKPVLEKIPFLLLAIGSSIITMLAQRGGGAVATWDRIPLTARLQNAIVAYASYMGDAIWPARLAVMYPYVEDHATAIVGAAALLLIGITAIAFRVRFSRPYVTTGWLWFLGTLVPMIGLVQVGIQQRADRYTYVPLIGVFMVAAWLAADVAETRRRLKPMLIAMWVAAVCALGVRTHVQAGVWHDSVRLFQHSLAVTTSNAFAHNNLASALQRQGRFADALHHYREAVRINPNYQLALNNLGNLLMSTGDLEQAVAVLNRAVKVRPETAESQFLLGAALYRSGQIEPAIGRLRESLRLRPEFVNAHVALGRALAQQGQMEQAINQEQLALEFDPRCVDAHLTLGMIFVQQQKLDAAAERFVAALNLQPNNAQAMSFLGRVRASQGRLDEAIRLLREALRLDPANAETQGYLQAALQLRQRQPDS